MIGIASTSPRAETARPAGLVDVNKQKGAALLVSLLMLVMVLMLGISAARIAIQGEKASRNDRDRQIALQAAEAGLLDAELDIEGSPDKEKGRSEIFSSEGGLGFPDAGCASAGNFVGLCAHAGEGAPPVWQTVDFIDTSDNATTVPFGRFTGYAFQAGKGSLPARPPRYIIEQLLYTKEGEAADKPSYFYRITAIGFGVRETTQVVLQTFYRKGGA